MTRVLPAESRYSKTIKCPVCHEKKIVHRRNAKYCSSKCRVRACLRRQGRWKGTRVLPPGFRETA